MVEDIKEDLGVGRGRGMGLGGDSRWTASARLVPRDERTFPRANDAHSDIQRLNY